MQKSWQMWRALPWHPSPSCWVADTAVRSWLHMAACRWLWANTGRWLHYLWSLFIFWCSNIYISFFSFANSLVGRRKLFLLLKRLSLISGCQVQLKRLTTLPRAGLAKSQWKSTAWFLLWLRRFKESLSWLVLTGFFSNELAASLSCTLDWRLPHRLFNQFFLGLCFTCHWAVITGLQWFDWILNHVGATALGVSLSVCPERINRKRMIHSKCGWCHAMGRVPTWIKK